MRKIIDRKYSTKILYDYLSHACDLIQAGGFKRMFEYYALKNGAECTGLMRRMANRRFQSAFPDLKIAASLLEDFSIERFMSLNPSTVTNDFYSKVIQEMLEAFMKHECHSKQIYHEESKVCQIEDFDVIEDFSVCSDSLCKELNRILCLYRKYG
jgi:hypothetical protein